ncbi:MAG: LacI family transcriptional regulator [Spirochaetes bacterium]|nr:LacI family transcriptional regulator [Spirochaetota bacterium]MBU1079519.1 LacI family transcriptional regulator [Spirochaetota bacterium]
MAKNQNPTLKQIAEITGFSQSSVSMILNGRKEVSFSEDTVRLVQSAAERLGYAKKSDADRRARDFGGRLVAVVCPNISNPYYSTLVQSIEQAAAHADYSVITLNTYRSAELEARHLALLGGAGIAGIIFTIAPRPSIALDSILGIVPAVVIGDKGGPLSLDTVEMDNYSASVLLARHLIGLGHRHIAYISTTLDSINGIRLRRLRGLEDTFGSECPGGSILVRSRDVSPEEELKDLFIEHQVGYELMKECLAERGSEDPATAIVAVNDMVAYGAIDAIVEAGLSIPADYSVCGFDNIFPSRLSPISLTTVDNYIVDKGRNAFSMLLARIGGNRGDPGPDIITRVEFTPRLVIRGSTGQVPKAGDARRKKP